MEERDLLIVKCLSKGLKINEIPLSLKKEHGVKVSVSTIEKSLTAMRKQFAARTLFQLASVLKENGII